LAFGPFYGSCLAINQLPAADRDLIIGHMFLRTFAPEPAAAGALKAALVPAAAAAAAAALLDGARS
jgi:hypothetical protein